MPKAGQKTPHAIGALRGRVAANFHCCFFFLNSPEMPFTALTGSSAAALGASPAPAAPLFKEHWGFARVPPTVKGNIILPFESLAPARPPKIEPRGLLPLAARLASPWYS